MNRLDAVECVEGAMANPPPYPRRRGKWIRLLATASAAAVAVFGTGFALFANHVSHLAPPAIANQADAIIVLTGGQSRLDAAVDLLKDGKGRRLLISGVNPAARASDLQRVTGGDSKLFNCCVDIDRDALDTIGNAEQSAKWMDRYDFGSVILVTNNYHMPRSLLEMGRLLQDAELTPYPVVNSRIDDGAWLTKPDVLRVLFTEYTKYLAALARGALPVAPYRQHRAIMHASTVEPGL